MDNLEIKTKNLKKNIKNNNYTFKPIPDSINIKDEDVDEDVDVDKQKNNNYKIKIRGIVNEFIQFKLNTKFVNKVIVEYDGSTYLLEKIPLEGVLLNFYISYQKCIIIKPFFKEECARLNLFDFEFLKVNELEQITWDKIFIINLSRRTDRKQIFLERIEKEELEINSYEFIDGVDGYEPDIKSEFDEYKKSKLTQIVSSGHWGCLMSHIKAIEKAKQEDLDSVLILEDDVLFDKNFKLSLDTLLIPNYDMLYLGGIIPEIKFFNLGWGKRNEIMGAYAYIIKKHMYEIILEKLYQKIYCVDIAYIEYIQPNYNVLILDDIIKTNLDSSDTSYKNKVLIKLLDRTNIKPIEIKSDE
jgi:hypothetical protein